MAWESARTTGIITEFDLETIQKLTQVDPMPQVLTDRTLINILDYYFTAESQDVANLDKILVRFQLRFWEWTGQEERILTLSNEVLTPIGA